MTSPLISVLIPAYNCERWLGEAITSALEQTWPAVEVIVVDDGSTDSSLEVARRYASSRVRVVAQENQGASAARNRAFQEAQGEFLQYLDADDLLHPDKLAQQFRCWAAHDPQDLISASWSHCGSGITDAEFNPDILWQDLEPLEWICLTWEHFRMMPPHVWLVPRSLAAQVGPWNEELTHNDDGEFFCRVILQSRRVRFCSEAKVYYRNVNPGSLSKKLYSERSLHSWFRVIELNGAQVLARRNDERTRQALATEYQRFVYLVYPQAEHLCAQAERRVRELGGTALRPPSGGRVFRSLSAAFGWKNAMRVYKRFVQR